MTDTTYNHGTVGCSVALVIVLLISVLIDIALVALIYWVTR
jgi:hypothetical protein